MENNIIGLKKIVGNKYNGGIYAITDKSVIRLIDVNNSVVANLNVEEKIRILNIFLDSIIRRGVDKELLNVSLLFDKIMDLDNINLEKSINELYKKVMFLYSKPNIDIKEILSISELLSNRLDTKSVNNEFVKEELKKRLHYI